MDSIKNYCKSIDIMEMKPLILVIVVNLICLIPMSCNQHGGSDNENANNESGINWEDYFSRGTIGEDRLLKDCNTFHSCDPEAVQHIETARNEMNNVSIPIVQADSLVYSQVKENLKKAKNIDNLCAQVYLELTTAYVRLGQYDSALIIVHELNTIQPCNQEYHFLEAMIYDKLSKSEKADRKIVDAINVLSFKVEHSNSLNDRCQRAFYLMLLDSAAGNGEINRLLGENPQHEDIEFWKGYYTRTNRENYLSFPLPTNRPQ